MKGKVRKILSCLLIVGLLGGMCQVPAEKVMAASKKVTLNNLGSHGTTTIGSKKKIRYLV